MAMETSRRRPAKGRGADGLPTKCCSFPPHFAAQYQTVKIVKYKGFFYAAGTGPGNRRVDIP